MTDATFQFEGEPRKWMTYPCQARGAEGDERCRISLRPHQTNAMGASWSASGPDEAPTVAPSILCGDKARPRCHFHIQAGAFKPCGDHQKG